MSAPASRTKGLGQRVREGRLGRLAGMAKAGAGVARGMLEQDPVAPLSRAVETLADLRGLGAKVGQMAGIWSAMLPEEQRLRAEPLLARLRAGTTSSTIAEVRALVESELGGPIASLFASWDDQPFASASIGQVHAATLTDGTRVAVKVQHPGIAEAVRADLDNAARIGGVAGLLMLPGSGAELMREVRERIEAELDYEREAAALTQFAAIVEGDPVLRVPTLVPERSTKRVLTTHFVEGETVDHAAARSTARDQGRAIRGFFLSAWLDHGLLFADPHAGNWIFHPDGHVTVLDFGCVIPFAEPERARVVRVNELIRAGRVAESHAAIAELLGVDPRKASATFVEPLRLALAPLVLDRPAEVADLTRLADATAASKGSMLGRRIAIPSWMPLTLRALVGTISLLVTLENGRR
jgi:predicted unusual protein kinase regulating ubiquinone biosynthesis (AarF/ABC1/UbiB family)